MKLNELRQAFLTICPNGSLEEDLNGALVFYTNSTVWTDAKGNTPRGEEVREIYDDDYLSDMNKKETN